MIDVIANQMDRRLISHPAHGNPNVGVWLEAYLDFMRQVRRDERSCVIKGVRPGMLENWPHYRVRQVHTEIPQDDQVPACVENPLEEVGLRRRQHRAIRMNEG